MILRRIFKGFQFAKVGEFYLSDTALSYKKNKKDKSWENPTSIQLVDKKILNAECSTYLVTLGDNPTENEILYVGEYTNSLGQRWFREHKEGETWVSWHSENLDDNLNLLLKKLDETAPEEKCWTRTKSNSMNIDEVMSALIEKAISDDGHPKVSLWLTTNPYYINSELSLKVNMSRSIEQLFLEDTQLALPFNSKGRSSAALNTKPVEDILRTISEQVH